MDHSVLILDLQWCDLLPCYSFLSMKKHRMYGILRNLHVPFFMFGPHIIP